MLSVLSGLNHYDFEARTLIPQICLFSTPDPKAGDYPGLNPYLYCAANPQKYIDLSGKKLHAIFAGNDDIFEINYNDDRNLALYDNRGNEISEDSYSLSQSSFMNAIAYLSQSETAMGIINSIIDSKTNVYVNCGQYDNSFNPKTYTVNWDPSSIISAPSLASPTSLFTRERPSAIGLAHELGHAEDSLNGTFNNDPWVTFNSINGPETIIKAEITAINKENRIREELNLPIRVSYLTSIHLDEGEASFTPNFRTIINPKLFLPSINVKKNIYE